MRLCALLRKSIVGVVYMQLPLFTLRYKLMPLIHTYKERGFSRMSKTEVVDSRLLISHGDSDRMVCGGAGRKAQPRVVTFIPSLDVWAVLRGCMGECLKPFH